VLVLGPASAHFDSGAKDCHGNAGCRVRYLPRWFLAARAVKGFQSCLSISRVAIRVDSSDEECPEARVDELILKDAPDLLQDE
jgi:hypothetical protein